MTEGSKVAASSEPWTVMRLLEWTTDFFRKRGSDSPRLDAEILLAHARDCSRIELYTDFNSEPTVEQREAFREMVRRRGDGAPVAYLVGYREFYSLRIRVNESVLIPRPETEHLVIEALDRAKAMLSASPTRELHVIDVGTGSGAIAIALAKHLPTAVVTAIDVSETALEIARWNVNQHGLADRVQILQGDLLEPLEERVRSQAPHVDLIVSNPPYVSVPEYDQLSSTVRDHEPRGALVGGDRGTEVIERLIDDSGRHLVPAGFLIFELSPMIADACEQLLAASEKFEPAKFTKDFAGHRRVISAKRLAS